MKNLYKLIVLCIIVVSCEKDKGPTANFSYSGQLEAGQTVSFNNLSANADEFSWEFGDEAISNFTSPTHIFSKPGNYGVSLTSYGNNKAASVTKTVEITGTTYALTNNCSFTVYDFATFAWDGSYIQDLNIHGTLMPGATTVIVVTKRIEIYFAFSFEPEGSLYFCAAPFELLPDTHNDLNINDYTEIISGSSKGSLGLTASSLSEIIKSAEKQ